MLQAGDIVEAEVSRVEVWGTFLTCEGQEIFVQVTEWSWLRFTDERARPRVVGDKVNVLLYGLVEEHQRWVGSVREASPNDNPWRAPSAFSIGRQYRGTVCAVCSYGAFIELLPGAEGLLPRDAYHGDIAVGDTVDVEVVESDVERKRIVLRLA